MLIDVLPKFNYSGNLFWRNTRFLMEFPIVGANRYKVVAEFQSGHHRNVAHDMAA